MNVRYKISENTLNIRVIGVSVMKDLTKGNPSKLILEFAIPIFVGNIFQLFYSLIDMRIVGSTLGNDALASVGATSTMNNLIVGFLIGLTNGFAVRVAQDFGAQDFKGLKKDVGGTLKLGILISALLTLISVSFLTPILRLLNMPESLMRQGTAYIRVILLGMTISMLYNICASVLRAMGDTITPLIFLVVSTVLNVGLDYLFILGFHTDVEGAAYATLIAQSVSVVLCLGYMYKKYSVLHLKMDDFKLSREQIQKLLGSGLSMGFMQSFVSLGTVALQGAINTLGTNTIVAHTGARKVTELYMLPFSVLGMTMATYCGQNLGAGEIKRIKEGVHRALAACFVWCALVVGVTYTAAPILIQMVTATEIQEVVDTASWYLRVDTVLYFVTAVICIYRNALQGLGDHTTPILSSFIELIGKVLIAIWLTPKLRYLGIILAEPIVWCAMVIPLIIKMHTMPILKQTKEVIQEKNVT